MSRLLRTFARVPLAALGLVTVLVALGSADAASSGAVVLTVAAAALAMAFVVAVSRPVPATACVARPRGAIDVSAAVPQSDPDAAGHARPRAPGGAASAA